MCLLLMVDVAYDSGLQVCMYLTNLGTNFRLFLWFETLKWECQYWFNLVTHFLLPTSKRRGNYRATKSRYQPSASVPVGCCLCSLHTPQRRGKNAQTRPSTKPANGIKVDQVNSSVSTLVKSWRHRRLLFVAAYLVAEKITHKSHAMHDLVYCWFFSYSLLMDDRLF